MNAPRRRRRTGAKLSDKREPYSMAVPLSAADRQALEERADAELRSLSNYVATLILKAATSYWLSRTS